MLTSDDIKIIEEIVSRVVGESEKRLKRAIKKEHKVGGKILQYLEVENRKTNERIDKLGKYVGFASV